MTGTLLITNAILLAVYMTAVFVVGKIRRRLDTVDSAWGIGFMIVAWSCALLEPSRRSLLVAALVSIWGLRLTIHIWTRGTKSGDDPRYKELSSKWRGNFWLRAYFSVFLFQGLLVLIISLPIVMLTGRQLPGLQWLTAAGTLIWLIGFCFESVADRQLRNFLSQKDHPKLLQTGLWRYSRHPNYFGELVQWWAISLVALQASYGWVGLAGPLVLTLLIVFVSGIPPIEKRRQDDPEYQEYKRHTSVLIPLPRRSH